MKTKTQDFPFLTAAPTNYKTFNKSKSSELIDVEVYSTKSSEDAKFSKSALRDFLTVVALSLHAIFEGLAVGLEKDQHDVWILFAGDFLCLDYGSVFSSNSPTLPICPILWTLSNIPDWSIFLLPIMINLSILSKVSIMFNFITFSHLVPICPFLFILSEFSRLYIETS